MCHLLAQHGVLPIGARRREMCGDVCTDGQRKHLLEPFLQPVNAESQLTLCRGGTEPGEDHGLILSLPS